MRLTDGDVRVTLTGGTPITLTGHITRVTITAGRPRHLDLAPAGVMTVEMHTTRPRWVSTPAEFTVPFLGRVMTLEARNGGTSWLPGFYGRVEDARCDLIGSGRYGAETVRWTFQVCDAIHQLAGVAYPTHAGCAEETWYARLNAATAAAAVTWYEFTGFGTSYPNAMAGTFQRDMKTEIERTLEPFARLTGSHEANAVYIVPWKDVRFSYGTLQADRCWLVSSKGDRTDLEAGWSYTGQYWYQLPVPVSATVAWPLASMANAVTTHSARSGTQPYLYFEDAQSIAAYGRRTFTATSLETAEAGWGSETWRYGRDIRDEYSQPYPRLTTTRYTFSRHLDTVTTTATLGAAPTGPAGFAWVLSNLYVSDRLEVRLPPDDDGVIWRANGTVCGYRWEITPAGADLEVYTDSRVVAVVANQPTLALQFTAGGQLTVPIPSTVDPLDVEVWMDLQLASTGNDQNIFLSRTTGSTYATLVYNNGSFGALFQDVFNSWFTEPASIDTDRCQVLFRVGGQGPDSHWLQATFVHANGTTVNVTKAASETYDQDYFAAGATLRVGWTSGQFAGKLWRFIVRSRSTGNVWVDIDPRQFNTAGWTDSYGNVITKSGTITQVEA